MAASQKIGLLVLTIEHGSTKKGTDWKNPFIALVIGTATAPSTKRLHICGIGPMLTSILCCIWPATMCHLGDIDIVT